MELTPVHNKRPVPIAGKLHPTQNSNLSLEVHAEAIQSEQKPFIEANTQAISLRELKNDCIIPVFSKDNEKTIAHTEFIEIAQNCIANIFQRHVIAVPEIRVSHQIKGRIPEAIYKPAKDLLNHEKTQYFERMAFVIRIPSIVETINGNQLALIAGGVRAYNNENLYSKKSIEKFKFFIGFQNLVCCNLCISTDGFADEMRVSDCKNLEEKIMFRIISYFYFPVKIQPRNLLFILLFSVRALAKK